MAKEYIDIKLALALCEDKRWRLHDIHDLGGWSAVTELQADIRALPAADVRENVIRTKADRIRAMSDEELAKYLFDSDACPYEKCQHPYEMMDCDMCWLDWLKSPVEVEE